MALGIIGFMLAVFGVMYATEAHADESTFINEVQASGEWGGPMLSDPGSWLNVGYQACAMVHAGRDPVALADSMPFPIQRVIVQSALRNLC